MGLARLVFWVMPLWVGSGLALAAETHYFPGAVWGPSKGAWTAEERDQSIEKSFGAVLKAAQEGQLWRQHGLRKSEFSLRLIVSPTWDNPTLIRLDQSKDGVFHFTFKALSGQGGYDIGHLAKQTAGRVSSEDVARLQSLLAEISPLTAKTPSELPLALSDSGGTIAYLDGTTIVLEVRKGEVYNAFIRHQLELPAGAVLRRLVELLNEISKGRLIEKASDF